MSGMLKLFKMIAKHRGKTKLRKKLSKHSPKMKTIVDRAKKEERQHPIQYIKSLADSPEEEKRKLKAKKRSIKTDILKSAVRRMIGNNQPRN